MKMTPCNDYFFVLDRVKPITEGAIESWLVGAEPKLRQHRFVNIIHTSPFVTTFPVYIMPFRVNLTWFMLDLLCCRNLGSAPTSHDSITPSVIGFTLSRTKKQGVIFIQRLSLYSLQQQLSIPATNTRASKQLVMHMSRGSARLLLLCRVTAARRAAHETRLQWGRGCPVDAGK